MCTRENLVAFVGYEYVGEDSRKLRMPVYIADEKSCNVKLYSFKTKVFCLNFERYGPWHTELPLINLGQKHLNVARKRSKLFFDIEFGVIIILIVLTPLKVD